MFFSEFIEAVCRVADKLAIPHLVNDDITIEEMKPEYERIFRSRGLGEKIEALILQLSKKCLGKAFHDFTTVQTYK